MRTMLERVDHLLLHASSLVTLGPGGIPRTGKEARELGIIRDGAVAVRGRHLVAVGASADLIARFEAAPEHTLDLHGMTVLPGFVDPHTHVLFAGSRESEFENRLAGMSYMEIAAAGGGILSSVRAFREASDEAVREATQRRLDEMLAWGTTTIEAKSGYGLNVEQEIRALRLIDDLNARHPIDLLPTLLGAHDVGPELRHDRPAYVRLVIDQMIPRVASETSARFCDVFCEQGVFTPEESRAILVAARARGLQPRLHADEFAPSGAAELAGELRALSADHLTAATPPGLAAMRDAGVIAILLPTASLSLRLGRYARAREMIEMGLAIALGTDCNPGSSMTTHMPLVLALAVLGMEMHLGEALTGATVNAAASLGVEGEVGRLVPGLRADLQILPTSTPAGIVYHLGGLAPARVMKAGRWVGGNDLQAH